MRFQLTPRLMNLDDLDVSLNSLGILRDVVAKLIKIDLYSQ